MTLESNKILGGVGAILLLVGVLPVLTSYTFGVIGLVGLILILISLHGFANLYNERGIFNNAIYGVLAGVVGAVVSGIVAVLAIISSLTALENFLVQIFPNWTRGDWASLSGMTPTIPSNVSSLDFSPLATFLAAVVVIFVVLIVFAIVATFFFRRSLKQLSGKSGVGLFSTAGLVLFIGAFLLILFILPGLVVMWVGGLILAIAFFTMKPHEAQQPPMVTVSPPQPTPV
jgi:uncharacterized membrane protein